MPKARAKAKAKKKARAHLPRVVPPGTTRRVKTKRGGGAYSALVAARDAYAADCAAARIAKADEEAKTHNEKPQRKTTTKMHKTSKKMVVPLSRAFMRAYAANYADEGALLPSDLAAMRAGIRSARERRLPAWYAPFICLCKFAPCIRHMVDLLSSADRPCWRLQADNVDFILECAIKVRVQHEDMLNKGDKETKAWTQNYHITSG